MKKLTCSLLSIIILLTISCEIGLGASVDTEPPSLSIDTSIADKVIRGDFDIRGTYSDDGVVESPNVVLKRTDGTGTTLFFSGELAEAPTKRGSGTWKISIPAESKSITDGTYQADITIKDGFGRTTIQSTIFTIDNTAPVIVLTRPTNNDTYGQKFTIEGQAADTNNIDRIEIQLFKDEACTIPAGEAPIVLKQVPLSISMDAASYESSAENYIYEGESADGKTKEFSISVPKDGTGAAFYCKIFAYDGASRYLGEDDTPAADDDKGNKVDFFYLYKDIYTPILQYYKITELYSILSNTYKEEAARAVSSTTVKADLDKYQKKTSYFTLNPKNNPTFTLTGKSPLELDGNDFSNSANEILNGQSVFIEVSPGLDNIPLDEASLKVYVQECDASGKIKAGAPKIYPPATKEEKGSTYRFNVKLNRSEDGSGLKINGCYIFGVEGHDQSDAKNLIEPAGRAYGFRLAASGNGPSLQVTTPADAITYIKKDGVQKFTGFVEVEMGTPVLLVYKDNDQDGSIVKTIEFTEEQGTKTSSGYKYPFDFDYDNFDPTNKFILKANLGGQLSQPVERTIVYDVEAPIITITKPATAKKFTDNFGTEAPNAYINGRVEFFVMLNDKGGSGLDATTDGRKPKWEILNAASPSTVLDSGIITETTGQTIPVNTAESKFNGKTIIFRVTAYDVAGNKGTTSANDANYTFIVDQETDKPYIGEDQNYTKLDFAQNDLNAYYAQTGSKVGNVQKGDSLKFTLYEDDGTAKLKIVNKKLTVTQNGSTYSSNWESNVANLTNVVFDSTQDTPNKLVNVSSYTFPTNIEDCGFYEYAIIAEDNSDSAKRTVKGPFLVRITQDKAAISVKAGKEYAEKDVEVINTITVTPSEGDYKLYRQIVKVGGAYNPSTANADTATSDISQYKLVKNGTKDTFTDAELSASSNTITDSLKIGDYDQENNIIVYYLLLDGAGNASDQKSVTLKIDNDKPEVTIKSPVEGKTNKKALTEVTQFNGKLDDHGKAGTIKVFYKFTNKANPSEAGTVSYPATGYKEEEASDGPFTVDIDYFLKANATQAEKDAVTNAGKTYLTEGKWYFHVYAEDDAGNTSDPVSREFHIDLTEPVLIVTIPDSENCIKKGDVYYFKNTLAGTVKASDTSGQISLDYKVDDTSVEFTQTSTANANEYNWTTDGFGLADAANKFIAGNPQKLTVEVTDPFTKTNTVNLTVYKDTKGPVVTPVNPGNVFGDSVTITATASDAGVGVANVLWSKTSNGTYENLTPAQGSWSKVFASTDLGTDEGEKTLWFKAIDALGNEGTPVSVSFQYDKELPHIIPTDTYRPVEINYINKNIAGSSFKLKGKAWDSNKLASVQLKKDSDNPETLTLTGNINTAKDEDNAVTWNKTYKVTTANNTDSAYLADGTYTFTISAYDVAGRKSSTDITKRFIVDTSEPTLKLNALPGKENTKASSYIFRGTAGDGTGSGVDKVYLKISAGTGSSAAYKEVLVEGTDSWSYEVNFNDETEDANGNKWSTVFADEGTKIVTLRAVDYAGNEVTSFKLGNASERDSDTFIFDKANPVLYVDPTTVLEYMPSTGFKITGTAKDTYKLATSNALKVTQVAEKDGNSSETNIYITSVNGATTIQNWELDVPFNSSGAKITPEDGTTYKYKFQLTDEVGNKDTDTPVLYSTTVDLKKPSLVIDNPKSKNGTNAVSETNYQFNGTFTEKNIEGIYYQILPSTETVPTASATPLDETSWTDWIKIPSSNLGTSSWNFFQSFKAKNASGDGLPEGSYKVYLYAVDKAGNVSEGICAAFDVDMKDPVVTLTPTIKDIYNVSDISEGATSGSFTLSFTVEESNGKQSYEISDGTKTYTPTLSEGTYSYKFTFGSGASGDSKLSEGTHNLKVTVTDIVGKTAVITKTVVIDTSAPTLSNIKVNEKDSSPDAWYNTTDMKLSGTASDTGTGVSAVVYQTSTDGKTWSEDKPFVGTSPWNGTVSDVVSDTTSIKIIARDNAKNETSKIVGPWKIDINPPTLGTVKEGETKLSEENAYYSNGTKEITLTISASDGSGESGVDRIYVLPYTKLSAATAVDANKATQSGSNFTFTIDNTNITKSGTVYARIYDKAGNYTDENLFSITYDIVNPVLQSINLSDSFKKDATTYYVNPGKASDNKTFTISGIATDNLAIASVNLVMSVGTGDGSEKYNKTVTTGDWSFSNIDMSGWGGDKTEVNAVITVTDKAGNALAANNPISATFKIIFDKAAPTAKHELDASDTPKDLYFRIGAQNREDGSSTNAQGTVTWAPEWDSKDEDVGAKYSNGTYGNDTSIEIRGRFDDSGSGVKEIFYKIYGTDQKGTELKSLKTGVLSAPDGSFSLRDESTKRVFYTRTGSGDTAVPVGDTNTDKITVDGKVKYYKDITTNYREKLTGFSEGNNFLVLVVVDNVGNSSVDAVTIGDDTYPNFSLNIDRTAPTLTSDTTETQYTNADTGKTINLSGSVSDDAAGVRKVVILHPTETENGQPKEIKATLNNGTWSYSLDATSLASATKPTSIYAKAYDKAGSGNWTKVEVAKVVVDKADPVISLDAPDDADETNSTARQINGVIKLTGTASDKIGTTPNNKFTVTKLLYKMTKNASGTAVTNNWDEVTTTLMPNFSIASSENFTILNFDTTKLTDKATYQLCAVVEDAAGNKTESTPVEVMIDQDTDRPVITLSNLTLQATGTSYLKSTDTLYLSVTDDDGIAAGGVKYKIDGGEEKTLNGTSIKITGDNIEGEHTITFTITDKAGGVFSSTDSTKPKPKITDDSTYVDALTFTVVKKLPEITNISYIVTNKKTNTTETRTALGTLGGDYTKFKISLDAKATSGVSKVTAKFSDTIKYELHCSVDHDDANSHTWETKTKNADGTFTSDIDIANLSEIKKFDIIVEDGIPNDPMKKEMSVEFNYDNTAPTVNIKTVSGTAGVKQTMEFDTNESSMNYFIVTKTDATENDVKELEDNKWTLIKNTEENSEDDYTLSNSVFFDDTTDKVNHTKRYALYLVDLGFTTLTDLIKATDPFDELKDVKFWIKAVDKCGNIGYENTVVTVDPQGNRPVVALQSGSGTLKEGSTNEYQDKTAGGSIRFDGTVTDDREAKYVWMQIDSTGIKRNTDPVESDGFKKDDLTKLKDAGYTIGNMETNTAVSSDYLDSIDDEADVSNYGIRIPVNGNSWNFTINENTEFKLPNGEEGEAILAITIYATDADIVQGATQIHRSRPITQKIFIDSQRPYIKQDSLRLVHYTGNTEDASQSYTEGASVHGIWYLQGKIIDTDNGIKYVKIGDTTHVSSAGDSKENISGDSHYYVKAVERSGKYEYEFSVPIGNAEEGKVGTAEVTINAKENTTKELYVEKTFSVTYDNKAPEFITTASDVNVSLSQDVNNTNGFYYFGAKASEADVNNVTQSGVERIAFYFTRDLTYGLQTNDPSTYSSHTKSTTKDLFDVMIYHANTDSADVDSGNMIIDYDSMKYEDGLYWHTISGTVNGPTFTITATDAETKKKNLHIGGLAKINGVIYLINGVSGNNVTLSSNVTNESITVTADFAVCNVIDHSGERTGSTLKSAHEYGYGYYTDGIGDDGDMIMETFTKSSSDWIFDASINSKNLPDGPIKLHMVAFDKAGNYSEEYTMTGTVKNNAPRIAGLKIGTDLNGNGSVDEGEYVETYSGYYELGMNGKNEVFDATFPVKATPEAAQTSLLTIKGLTVVQPEIIGGNGKLTYSYSVKDYDNVNKKWGKKTITNPGQETETVTWDYETAENENAEITVDGPESGIGIGITDAVANVSDIILPVSDFIGTTDGTDSQLIKDGLLKKFTFKFKDSTPSEDSGDTSSSSTSKLNVILDVALREENAAKNWILPFYWKRETDNSLFKQSADEGHIELAKDWVTTTSYTGTSGEYDADPKVSGKIKIEGIAQDDTLLREIKVKFGKSMGGMTTANTTIASYEKKGGTGDDKDDMVWKVTALENDGSINSTTGWASAVQQATYQDLKDVGIISAIPDDKEATSKVPYTSQDYGHVVHWILYLNTEKVNGVAATDVTVTATATDRGTPKWNGAAATGNVAYTANTAEVTGKPATGDTPFSAVVTKTVEEENVTITTGALTGNYRVDVVPYITEVVRGTDDNTKPNKFNTNRARSGAVSLRRGDILNKIKGFNLNGDSVSVKITPNKNGSGTAVTMADVTAGNDITFTVSDSTTSGYLQLEVNNIATLNNINGYKDYNTETNAKAYDHNTLTDDRYVHIWRVSQQDTFKGSKNAVYPAMARGSDGTLYASFTNYGQSKTYYTKSFIGDNTVGVSSFGGYKEQGYDYTADDSLQDDIATVFYGYDPPEETDISVDSNGNVNVFYVANYHGGGEDNWNGTGPTDAGGIYVYDSSADVLHVTTNSTYYESGRKYAKMYRFELFTYDNELNQFKNLRVNRTNVNDEDYVNIAYYDRLTNAIKYSYATHSETTTTNTTAAVYYNQNNVTFTYNAQRGGYTITSTINNDGCYVLLDDGNYHKITRKGTNQNRYYTVDGYTANTTFVSSIYNTPTTTTTTTKLYDTSEISAPWVTIDGEGDKLDKTGTTEDSNETFTFTGGWTPYKLDSSSYSGVSQTDATGESVALTSTAEGYPIIMYMDAATGEPRIAFANSRTPTSTSNWTVQGVFASDDDNYDTASDYMSCIVDSSDNLHIAFQNTKGQLVYGKGTYNSTSGVYEFGASQVLDDSGMWIDMTMNGTTPYISYLSRVNSYDGMKLAYYDDNFDEDNDGSANGGWETLTAAMNEKVTNVRTCIEPNAKAFDGNPYTAAIGYHSGSDYRAAFYVGK